MKQDFILPARFENLKNCVFQLNDIIVEITEAIDKIREIRYEMHCSNSGYFLVIKGKSGCGKSTFINTLNIFFDSVEIKSIDANIQLSKALPVLNPTRKDFRVIILEKRESYEEISTKTLEAELHAINDFIRSENGENSIIIWPTNSDQLVGGISLIGNNIGGASLIDDDSIYRFSGPPKDMYYQITKNTFEYFNRDKTLLDLGISKEICNEILEDNDTLGDYINSIIKRIVKNEMAFYKKVNAQEIFSLWIVVIAGNNPTYELNTLTKGVYNSTDIESLLNIGDSNIAQRLRLNPKIGLLANKLNCKILSISPMSALSIIKSYQNDRLNGILKQYNISFNCKKFKYETIMNSTLADALFDSQIKIRNQVVTKDERDEFSVITKCVAANNNDKILNKAIGEALINCKLIDNYETEKPLGIYENRRADLSCSKSGNLFNLEMMWRDSISEKDIAKYTLEKLFNYGVMLGLL